MKNRPEIPRPEKLSFRLLDLSDGFGFRIPVRSWGLVFFLLIWLSGWTAACVLLGWQAYTKRELVIVLFAIPFWLGWIAGFLFLVYQCFGNEYLVLNFEGVTFRHRAIINLNRRSIPLAELRKFSERVSRQNNQGKTSFTRCIELTNAGPTLRFGASLSQTEREWLIQELSTTLEELRRNYLVDGDVATNLASERDSRIGALRTTAALSAADVPIHSPSENRWQLFDDYQSVLFRQRGRFSLFGLLGTLFICLFWNGIVSVFACLLWGLMPDGPPRGTIEWWGLFAFLIPFEIIGLLLLMACLLVLLEPVRTTRWTVSADEVRCRIAWFGLLGYTWRYPVDSPPCLTVTNQGADLPKSKMDTPAVETAGLNFVLSITGPGDVEYCAIRDLSQGEARWMADVLLQNHSDWFARI